jgi:imidazole glycerol-phosphate synthase subunit HisH
VTRIAILDYGMGNLRSAQKALERVGATAERLADADSATGADGLVLPGVGAFPEAMRRLRGHGFDGLAADWVAAGRPLLGICLGMQLLFESSSEGEGAEGLGLLEGDVTELDAPGLKVPHMGWEPVRWERPSRFANALAAEAETPFYFVHSLAARPAAPEVVVGTAEWGERFAAVVERGSVFGAQFHPEKSSAAGLALLAGFVAACEPVPASMGRPTPS